jgi:hypothetical protein
MTAVSLPNVKLRLLSRLGQVVAFLYNSLDSIDMNGCYGDTQGNFSHNAVSIALPTLQPVNAIASQLLLNRARLLPRQKNLNGNW